MATYYVTVAGGGLNDGSSEANAWTLPQATAGVAAGDKVWVKAGTYSADDSVSSSVMDIDVAGTVGAWVEWEAYTTTIGDFTIGDAQPVILDASVNTLANAMQTTTVAGSVYNRLTGFRFTGGSSHGIDGSTVDDWMALIGCKIDGNGGRGIQWDDNLILACCEITGNTTNAIDADSGLVLFGCKIHGEAVSTGVITCITYTAILNTFYNNANGQNLYCTGAGSIFVLNSMDGDAQAASTGLAFTQTANIPSLLANNIFFDFNTAVDFLNAGVEEAGARLHNLFFSNTTDYDVLSLESSEIAGTSDPFTASATRDYSLKSGSEGLDAGIDGSVI